MKAKVAFAAAAATIVAVVGCQCMPVDWGALAPFGVGILVGAGCLLFI